MIILLKFLTLPLIVSVCLRVAPTSTEFICKSRILDPIQDSTDLTVFQDFRIATFPLDFIMYEVNGLSFNQEQQHLCVDWCLWCWLLNSSIMTLIKMYPYVKQNHLLTMIFFPLILPYFNAWFRKFHQNYRVLSNVVWRSTLRFKVEARAKSLEEASIGCYWWIGSQYRINSSLLHNCMLDLKYSNNVIPTGIMKK